MSSAETIKANQPQVIAYLEEQSALVRSGGNWNCLAAARELASLLVSEGRRPWIARLRKTEMHPTHVFHGPLIPRVEGVAATWTTHYVCCCDGNAYDPLVGEVLPIETYSLKVFGEQIALEVFAEPGTLHAAE